MADTMQFDLVSPERSLASVPVREVRLPGSDGDLTAMPGHAPTIVTLRGADGTPSEFAVTGGFAEVNQDSVSLLAERGHPREEITQDVYNDMMKDAHRAHRSAKDRREHVGEEVVTAAVKLLGDMQALGTHIGLDPNQSTVPD